MSEIVVGKIVPLGSVLHRPSGSESLAWLLYADSLEREEKLRRKLAKFKGKKYEKV